MYLLEIPTEYETLEHFNILKRVELSQIYNDYIYNHWAECL